jgi:hypothetical protein
VTYDADSGTAVIGTGLIWDTVYERLQDYNVTVVGGRVTGVSGPTIVSAEVFSTLPQIGRRRWLLTRRRLVS